jgi:hypothetical protein
MFTSGLIGYWMGYLRVSGTPITFYNLSPALIVSVLTHAVWNTIGQFLGIGGLVIMFLWAPAMLYGLYKLVSEALLDEYYWGYAHGYAPRETG